MDCPVCKYPNEAGVTHCGMCHEVFNRSAAQAYLHAMKRERRQAGDIPDEAPAPVSLPRANNNTPSIVANVDWKGLEARGRSLLKRSRKALLGGAGLILLWMLGSFLFNDSLWYHLFGQKMLYAVPDKAPQSYLVGMKQHIKIWSERQGRLDTPMEEFDVDEMGNIGIEKKIPAEKNRPTTLVNNKEWIQILKDSAGGTSRVLPKNHLSLAEGRLVFDNKGALLERHYRLSPRVAKSVFFIAPKFPVQTLRHHRTWNETVEWLDAYNDWKIYWSATLHWTLGELVPCGKGSCARLTYTADLRPQLRGGPSWAHNAIGRATATSSAEGEALFDLSLKRVVANTFSYDGLLHLPLKDLGYIPWELRIGRRVKGQPGEILIRFENKIDIRKT